MQLIGQSIYEVKNATMVNTQAIANHLGEWEKGKFLSQPMPNPKGQFVVGSSSNPVHRQEHVQAIVTLRSGRQVDNQVVLPKENNAVPQGQESHNNVERDA